MPLPDGTWDRVGHWAATRTPGLLVAAMLALLATAVTAASDGMLSGVTAGVLLGLVVANVRPLHRSLRPGARFAMGPILRFGIVLLGARLSIEAVFQTGVGAFAVTVVCVLFALAVVIGVGRWLGLPPRLATLIAVGTAICGNSAIVATAPVIDADEHDVSYAVATITLFGTIAMLAYPMVGHALDVGDSFFGHWVGIAVNDTSQVTATGFAYSAAAGETATIVKLTRNTLLGPLLIVIGTVYVYATAGDPIVGGLGARPLAIFRLVPPFVVGFVGMAGINSLGFIPPAVVPHISHLADALILIALVGVGLSTSIGAMRRVGLRPLYLGFIAAASSGLLAWWLVALIVGF